MQVVIPEDAKRVFAPPSPDAAFNARAVLVGALAASGRSDDQIRERLNSLYSLVCEGNWGWDRCEAVAQTAETPLSGTPR